MTWIGTDNTVDALPLDAVAVFTARFDGGGNFHCGVVGGGVSEGGGVGAAGAIPSPRGSSERNR